MAIRQSTSNNDIEIAGRASLRGQMSTLVISLIAVVVVGVAIMIPPSRFADYSAYLWITDSLYYFPSEYWFTFEGVSHVVLLLARWLTGSTESAVDLSYHLLAFGFIASMAMFARRKEVDWRGLLVLFAVYGALMAFVTLRATPAYLLVALAALQANRGQRRCILTAGCGLLFHISAALALPPLLIGLAHNRYGMFGWMRRTIAPIIAGALVYIIILFFFRDWLSEALLTILNLVPFLSKYLVYTQSLDPGAWVAQYGDGLNQAGHLAYFFLASVLAGAFMLARDEQCRRMRAFVIVSYIVFLACQFSPITAFRQSPFWTIPAIMVFPWRNYARAGPLAVLFLMVCGALFVLTFSAVLA